jgi:hypothetical protein
MKQALDEANHTMDGYGLLMRLDAALSDANDILERARKQQDWPRFKAMEERMQAFLTVRRWVTSSLPHLKFSTEIPREWTER